VVQKSARFHFLLERCYKQIYIHLRSFLLVQHFFSQSRLCELLGQIHLEDLELYFFLLEVAQRYLLRIHELLHLLLFPQCLVFSYLIYFQSRLCEILDQTRLEDLEHHFYVLEVAQQYLQRIHELLRQLLFLQCLIF